MVVEQDTRLRILAAAKGALLDVGYANLSTRGIAQAAGVPLSQIHYHFGSKQNLMLAVLDTENRLRLGRQAAMYKSKLPLWKQWLQACDFFDDDLESGYVRVLMEMTAAGCRAGSICWPRWRSGPRRGSARRARSRRPSWPPWRACRSWEQKR
jgi:AcrR family transcriptional regulator